MRGKWSARGERRGHGKLSTCLWRDGPLTAAAAAAWLGCVRSRRPPQLLNDGENQPISGWMGSAAPPNTARWAHPVPAQMATAEHRDQRAGHVTDVAIPPPAGRHCVAVDLSIHEGCSEHGMGAEHNECSQQSKAHTSNARDGRCKQHRSTQVYLPGRRRTHACTHACSNIRQPPRAKVAYEQLGGVATANGKNRALYPCKRSCSLGSTSRCGCSALPSEL